MTDEQSELNEQVRPDNQAVKKPDTSTASRQPVTNWDAIATGLEFLFSVRQQAYWSLRSGPNDDSAVWCTGYILTRLAEIPPDRLSFEQHKKIEESLDWLLARRTLGGGWKFDASNMHDDADTTSWVVTAFRQHDRMVPIESLEFIRRCRCNDGGFAFYSDEAELGEISKLSSPEVTAIAARAMAAVDGAACEFLALHLQSDVAGKLCRLASTFFVSSAVLDWEPGTVPLFLLNAVRQLTCHEPVESAWEKALLLRCMMRLRMQSAWALGAALRQLQRADGSWPGSAKFAHLSPGGSKKLPHFDQEGVLATVTALSALAMSELQPGLYFGSDLPFRRL